MSKTSLLVGSLAVALGALWYFGGVWDAKHPETSKSMPKGENPSDYVKNAKGIDLFTKSYPTTKPRAHIVLVTGYGEHIQRPGGV